MSEGVIRIAKRVEARVKVIDNATFPFARKHITFEAVPPGLQPTRTIPVISGAGRLNNFEMKKAENGIMKYWRKTPVNITFGDMNTFLKSDNVRVIPIPNITTVRSGMIAVLNEEK